MGNPQKKKFKGLGQRVLTAIIFVSVVVGSIVGGAISYAIVFGLITMLCVWEFLSLYIQEESRTKVTIRKILGIALSIVPFVLTVLFELQYFEGLKAFLTVLVWFMLPIVFLIFIYELFQSSEKPFHNIAFSFLGTIYIGIPFASLNFIALENGVFFPGLVFGILFLNWANDTGAYLIGSLIGKTPLIPSVSPNKTWEGTIGGVALALLFSWIFSHYFEVLSTRDWLVLGVLIPVLATLGDLVESKMKRSLNIKDTGSVLPGHGGFLDRFDSFFFQLPYVTVYILLIIPFLK